jgi:hypothetical protein
MTFGTGSVKLKLLTHAWNGANRITTLNQENVTGAPELGSVLTA